VLITVFDNNNIVCKTIQQLLILNSEIQEQTICINVSCIILNHILKPAFADKLIQVRSYMYPETRGRCYNAFPTYLIQNSYA